QAVGVDQGREEHSHVEHRGCSAVTRIEERTLEAGEGETIRLEAAQQGRCVGISQLELPGSGAQRASQARHGHGALKTDVMTLNGEGKGAGAGGEPVEGRPGTGRPVIQPRDFTFEAQTEEIAVFAEVVEKTS